MLNFITNTLVKTNVLSEVRTCNFLGFNCEVVGHTLGENALPCLAVGLVGAAGACAVTYGLGHLHGKMGFKAGMQAIQQHIKDGLIAAKKVIAHERSKSVRAIVMQIRKETLGADHEYYFGYADGRNDGREEGFNEGYQEGVKSLTPLYSDRAKSEQQSLSGNTDKGNNKGGDNKPATKCKMD